MMLNLAGARRYFYANGVCIELYELCVPSETLFACALLVNFCVSREVFDRRNFRLQYLSDSQLLVAPCLIKACLSCRYFSVSTLTLLILSSVEVGRQPIDNSGKKQALIEGHEFGDPVCIAARSEIGV